MAEKKIRVLCIIPYPGMGTVMRSLVKDYPHLDLTIYTGNLKGAVKIAEAHFVRDGYDLIISRGSTAAAIRKAGYPVIEIEISYYDIMSAIRLAEGITGKLAMVVFADLAVTARTLCDMLHYDIEIISVENLASARPTIMALAGQKEYTLLCDTIAYRIAQSLGMRSFMITSGAVSIRKAFEHVTAVSEEHKWLRAEKTFYRTLLSDHSEETFIFYPNGKLVYASVSDPNTELLSLLRRELPSASETTSRMVRKLRGVTYYIRVRKIRHIHHELTAFCIERRRIPALPGKSGLRYLSISELDNYFPDSSLNSQDVLNLYLADIERLAKKEEPVFIAGEDSAEINRIANTLYLHGVYNSTPLVYINCKGLCEKSLDFLLEHYDSPLTDSGTTIHIAQIQALSTHDRQRLIDLILSLRVWSHNRLILSCVGSGAPSSKAAEDILSALPCRSLNMISLRDRQEDIPMLVRLTLGHLNIDLVSPILEVEQEAMALLQQFSWPQNYVQFTRVIRELVSLARNQIITKSDVSAVLRKEARYLPFQEAPCETKSTLLSGINPEGTLAEMNREIARIVLAQTNNNQSAAAKRLGISRTTLWRLLKE